MSCQKCHFPSLKNWSNRRQARLVGRRSSRGGMLTKKNFWGLVEHVLDHQCAEGDGELKLWCREQGSKFQDLSHKKNLARARARARALLSVVERGRGRGSARGLCFFLVFENCSKKSKLRPTASRNSFRSSRELSKALAACVRRCSLSS